MGGAAPPANTLAAAVYGILKTPGVLAKVQAEADALFAKDTVTEADVLGLDYIQNCLKEAMRLWPGHEVWRQPPYEYETERLPFDLLTGDPRVRERLVAGWTAAGCCS